MESFSIELDGASLSCSIVPWDTDVFSFNVAQISHLVIANSHSHTVLSKKFDNWLVEQDIKLVSCRINAQAMQEMAWLEDVGFRFVELVLHPYTTCLDYARLEHHIDVCVAKRDDIPGLRNMASNSFGYERFHADPRLDNRLADLRYENWVENSFTDKNRELVTLGLDGELIGFFVYEKLCNSHIYWHLTAICPSFQGRGLGEAAWKSMLNFHRENLVEEVSTTITATNIPVLNLYSKLKFRFSPPQATFHLLR